MKMENDWLDCSKGGREGKNTFNFLLLLWRMNWCCADYSKVGIVSQPSGSSSMLSLHEWFGAFQKKKGAAFQNIPDTQPQLNRRQHSKCLTTIEATVQHYCHSAFNFSKAKILPMLAATVQHCYHPANMVPMLTLLPTTYPIGFSPLHSLHTSTTFAKLTFPKPRVC